MSRLYIIFDVYCSLNPISIDLGTGECNAISFDMYKTNENFDGYITECFNDDMLKYLNPDKQVLFI